MGRANNNIIKDIRYKESWRRCSCGSKIVFNAHLLGKVPEMCKRCQEIANMKQTKISEFDGAQKKIHQFNGN